MFDCVILDPDCEAGYQALHEYVQGGWEAHFHWIDEKGRNHIIMRRKRGTTGSSDQ